MIALGALVIALVAGLGGLTQLKFTSFLADSVEERLQIVAATSAQDFTAAIDLGLSLPEVANGTAILERARSHDEHIGSILVFDLDGNVLHAVGEDAPARVDDETREAFRLATAGITEPAWGVERSGEIASGIIIEGAFGQPVGGVVVTYPTEEMQGQAGVMAGRLLATGAGVAALMTIVVIGVLWLFRSRLTPESS